MPPQPHRLECDLYYKYVMVHYLWPELLEVYMYSYPAMTVPCVPVCRWCVVYVSTPGSSLWYCDRARVLSMATVLGMVTDSTLTPTDRSLVTHSLLLDTEPLAGVVAVRFVCCVVGRERRLLAFTRVACV